MKSCEVRKFRCTKGDVDLVKIFLIAISDLIFIIAQRVPFVLFSYLKSLYLSHFYAITDKAHLNIHPHKLRSIFQQHAFLYKDTFDTYIICINSFIVLLLRELYIIIILKSSLNFK